MPASTEASPIPIANSMVERMLHATRVAAMTGRTISAAISRMPTTRIESAIVTAASAAVSALSGATAKPAKATCPIPSPIRLSRRCTRKKPTAGASSPTTIPAPNASRMNSRSSMDVRGVVPDTGQGRGRPVEDDLAPDEHDALDEALDGTELVRDVEDRHLELLAEALEQTGDRLLR